MDYTRNVVSGLVYSDSRPLSGRMCYRNLQISNDVALFHEIDDPIKKVWPRGRPTNFDGCADNCLNEVIDIIGTGLRVLPLGFPPNLALSENYAQVRVEFEI